MQPPEWCEIRPDPPSDPALQFLDPGERAAILLALLVDANRLLIDEWEGRAEAERRRLYVTGTLGILAEAHQHHLLDFEESLARLRQTNFYISTELIDLVRRLLVARTGRP
jgi:predicted nucleic acid-binding protein